MTNRISSKDIKDMNTNSVLIVSTKCKASPNRSKVLISPSKELLYFFHKSDTFNMKSLQTKMKVESKLRIFSSKQKKKEKVQKQEMSFYQKYKREKSKSKQQRKKLKTKSQSLQAKSFKYQSLNSSKVDKSSEEYMRQLMCQIGQIRKKYSKNEQANKENKRFSTTDSCDSGASLILRKESINNIVKPISIVQNICSSYPITPIKKVGFKKPMSSAFKNDKKQKLKIIYNPKEKALNFDRKQSRETQAQEFDQQKLANQLQNTKLFQFTFGNMALMDYPHSMINSVQC